MRAFCTKAAFFFFFPPALALSPHPSIFHASFSFSLYIYVLFFFVCVCVAVFSGAILTNVLNTDNGFFSLDPEERPFR